MLQRTRRILIVEDEPLVAMMVEEMLRELDCSVVGPAGELAKALDLAGRAEFDAALLDLALRGMPSFPLADLLQANGKPFAFMTGRSAADLAPAYRGIPRLEKPFDLPELQSIIDSLVGLPGQLD